MKLSEHLKERGFINQFSGESLEKILDEEKRVFYLGVDPTADSLTIGNLAVYMLVRHLSDAGHTPILLVGGATGMIGDPGGKDAERKLLDEETLQKNIAGITKQVENILNKPGVKVVNNYSWLGKLSLIDFLRDVGKHFTVNAMIKKDIVKTRLDAESAISFTEFSYSLLQGYDFRYLFDEENCTLQVAGADQWTNALAGVDFIRKTRDGAEAFVLTAPLIVNPSTGKKFGKSEEGAVWLDGQKTSPYAMYQFLLNVEDEATDQLLKIYTLLSLDEIAELKEATQSAPHERKAQKMLAYEVTKFVHGEEAANSAKAVSEVLFSGASITSLDESAREVLSSEAPSCNVSVGDTIIDTLVSANLVQSKSQARQLIAQNAVSVNDTKITDPDYTLQDNDFTNSLALLRKGKKQIMVLLQG